MKRVLLLVAVLLAGCTGSDPRFLGMGWGTPKKRAIQTFVAKTHHTAKADYEDSLGQTPRFVNSELYGLRFDEATLSFREGGLSEYTLVIESSNARALDSAFVKLIVELRKELGQPTRLECRNYNDSSIYRRASWILDGREGIRDRVVLSIDYNSWLAWFGFRGYSNAMREGNDSSPGESETTPCEVVLPE